MRQIKNNLVGAINSLIKEGEEVKQLDKDHASNSEAGFFDRWSGSRQVENKLTEFKAKYHALQ